MDISNEIIHSGILRKKGGRLNVWSDRYFALKSNALYYYLRSSDNVRNNILHCLSDRSLFMC